MILKEMESANKTKVLGANSGDQKSVCINIKATSSFDFMPLENSGGLGLSAAGVFEYTELR